MMHKPKMEHIDRPWDAQFADRQRPNEKDLEQEDEQREDQQGNAQALQAALGRAARTTSITGHCREVASDHGKRTHAK
jgi:hypothetical protein